MIKKLLNVFRNISHRMAAILADSFCSDYAGLVDNTISTIRSYKTDV